MRVLLAGGGSAGHTSPLLATADALKRIAPGVEITCLGTRERIEAQIIPAAGYPLEFVPSVPLPRRPNADLARLPGRLRAALRGEARTTYGLRDDQPVLLVTGGSQGAASINPAVLGAAQAFADGGVQVLHVTGPAHEMPAPDTGVPYVVLGYVDRMDLAYSAADAVLCRSGSNTVTEVSGVGLPAVFVPLPIGNGEQAR